MVQDMSITVVEQEDYTLVLANEGEVTAGVTGNGREADVHIDIRGGHVDPAARATLVDALFALPAVRRCSRLRAAVPLGDTETIRQLTRRCGAYETRAAGATCLIDAEVDA
jgi:hypothetical protein